MMSDSNCKVTKVDGITVIAPKVACLDARSTKTVRGAVRHAISVSHSAVLDLGSVAHLDAAGMKAMLDWIAHAKTSKVSLSLSTCSRNARALLEVVRITALVDVFETVEAAVEAATGVKKAKDSDRMVAGSRSLAAAAAQS